MPDDDAPDSHHPAQPAWDVKRPDLRAFHQSLSSELLALKDRIRQLVRHWPTDGEHKEVALRSVLRRHLPSVFHVGRGFIVTPEEASPQIDVLIIDARTPALFRDGDLFIVTPDSVRAIIEVKTSLHDIDAAVQQLLSAASSCRTVPEGSVWTGLFAYEATNDDSIQRSLLRRFAQIDWRSRHLPSCASVGANSFLRWWDTNADGHANRWRLRKSQTERRGLWRSYTLDRLAPAYFLGNLLDHLTSDHVARNAGIWFPLKGPGGKEEYATWQIAPGDSEPGRAQYR